MPINRRLHNKVTRTYGLFIGRLEKKLQKTWSAHALTGKLTDASPNSTLIQLKLESPKSPLKVTPATTQTCDITARTAQIG